MAEVVSDARTMDGARAIHLESDGPVTVLGDPGRLEQLVHNLVGNALSHTPAGTPVHGRVGVESTADGDRAVLVVRDHGPGLTPDQADRVFDRFYRASTSREGGSGLGLFIVATLARGMGGLATVDSVPGEGSAFTVVLPLAPPSAARTLPVAASGTDGSGAPPHADTASPEAPVSPVSGPRGTAAGRR